MTRNFSDDVTPESVVAAYKATGVRPLRCKTVARSGDNLLACPVAALYFADDPSRLTDIRSEGATTAEWGKAILRWANERWGSSDVLRFTSAYDYNADDRDGVAALAALVATHQISAKIAVAVGEAVAAEFGTVATGYVDDGEDDAV